MIVTDNGFAEDDWTGGWQEDTDDNDLRGLEISADTMLPDDVPAVGAIRIRFESFADGRGFTLARQLRARGYTGRLRAVGHVLADQYAMARRSGFDEVEIDEELAARQGEAQWRARGDWRAHDYQARLGRRG